MRSRQFLTAAAAALASLKDRIEAAAQPGDRTILWSVSMFLWTSTQWKNDGSARFTDMLDVIKDIGFDGFRLTGWPQSLERYGMQVPVLEKELSRRNLRVATMSWGLIARPQDTARDYAFETRRATGAEVSLPVVLPITVCNCHVPTSDVPKLPESVHPPLPSVRFP